MYHLYELKKKYNALLERHKKAEEFKPEKKQFWEGCRRIIDIYEDMERTLEAIRHIEEVTADEVVNGFKI